MNKPYIIAEMGVNFYDTAKVLGITPLEAAKLYIDKAAEAGIDCAKFQSYKAGTIVSKNSPAYWDTSKETTKTQYGWILLQRHLIMNQRIIWRTWWIFIKYHHQIYQIYHL